MTVHVLFVSQYFAPEIGATQTRMHEFARACVARGHRVTVLTEFPNHPQGVIPRTYRGKMSTTESMDGFTVERVWVRASPVKTFRSRLLFYVSFLLMASARGVTLRGPIDVVVATSPPLPVALVGWIIARRHRARFVMDVRDLWPAAAVALGELSNPAMLRLASVLERFLYARADRITAVTRRFVVAISQSVRGRGRPVAYVPNGAATEVFKPGPPEAGIRARLGAGKGFIVTFAGNLGIAQGLGAVLEAAEILADDDVAVCFIGDGPAKDQLIARADASGLLNVRFLAPVPTAQVTPYLLSSDALLVTLSRAPVFEMFVPSKLFDSLACARPVILMANGEAKEILDESGGGIWVAPEDAGGLAAAIRSLAAMSPNKRHEFGERGHTYVMKSFTRAVQNDRMIEIIEEVAQAR